MGRGIKQRNLALIEAALSVFGMAALGFSGWYDWGHYNWPAVLLLLVGVMLIGANPLIVSLVKVETEAAAARIDERGEALRTLVDLTHGFFRDVPGNAKIRVTLLGVDQQREPALLQPMARCDNSGRREPGKHGMTIQQGVAGDAYRSRDTVITDFEPAQFRAGMMKLGFTEDEAKLFDERGSYMCTPVFDSVGNIIAILSVDSKQPRTFKLEVHRDLVVRFTPYFSRFLTTDD